MLCVMHVVHEFEPKEAINLVNLFKCVKRMLNQFSDVMPEKLPDELPPKKQIEHAIEVMLGMTPLAKAPYQMNHEELKELKVQLEELIVKGYIKFNVTIWGTCPLCSQERWDIEDVCGL